MPSVETTMSKRLETPGSFHRPPHPVLAAQCPITIAVVELEEGPRMISNVTGCDPSD